MAEPSLQELLQQLQENAAPSAKLQALIAALRAYDSQTARFRRMGRDRKLSLVTAKDKTRLMNLHQAIAKTADDFLSDKNEPEERKEIAHKIAALASGNYSALRQYDPAKGQKTLESLEEDVRTLTLHLGDAQLGDRLSGAQSERAPLSFLDSKGKLVSGVFTKKQVVEPEKQLQNAFNEITKDPFFPLSRDKDAVEWLRDNLLQNLYFAPDAGVEENAEPMDALGDLLDVCEGKDENGKAIVDAEKLKEQLGPVLEQGGFSADDLKSGTWNTLAENMTPIIGSILYAHRTGKIPYGGRIDNRNSAMSAVADLMGVPNLIARSRPMKIIDKDGNVIEGTFMEAAKGMDPENLPPEAENIKPTCLENTNGKGFKDLANLQVLDFLCGNYDRHASNIVYQFDKDGKLCGVQGIDNDGSFGAIGNGQLVTTETTATGGKKSTTNLNYLHMTNIGNMKAIPADTAKRIEAMTPEMLKYALRGYGLSEEELKCAGIRLTYLKQAISKSRESIQRKKKPVLRIMSDKDFKNAKITDLIPKMTEGMELQTENTFNKVYKNVPNLAEKRKNQQKEFQNLHNAVDVTMGNRAERQVAKQEMSRGVNLEAMLKKRTWWGFSSENYINLQEAVKNYVNVHKTLENRLTAANDEETKRSANYHREKEAVVQEGDLLRMQQASIRMRDAAVTYLQGKMPEFDPDQVRPDEPYELIYPAGASDYTKRRIDTALDVLKTAKRGTEIKAVETQTAQSNEREAEAAQQRRQAERHPELIVEQPVRQVGP